MDQGGKPLSEGFERLLGRFQPYIRRTAVELSPLLPAFLDVDDLVQEGLSALFQAAGRDAGRVAEDDVYLRMKIRWGMMGLIRRARHGRRKHPSPKEVSFDALGELSERLVCKQELPANPETALSMKELGALAACFRESLPPPLRMVTHLRFFWGFSYDEIGELMGISARRAGQLYAQAVKILRKRMGEILSGKKKNISVFRGSAIPDNGGVERGSHSGQRDRTGFEPGPSNGGPDVEAQKGGNPWKKQRKKERKKELLRDLACLAPGGWSFPC
jgi:RNA polymerase sigma factor (sigma-70 family)